MPVTLILTIMIALVGFRAEAQQPTQSKPQLVAEGAMALQERRFDVAMPYDDFQQLITQQ